MFVGAEGGWVGFEGKENLWVWGCIWIDRENRGDFVV